MAKEPTTDQNIDDLETDTVINMKAAVIKSMNDYGAKLVEDLKKDFDVQIKGIAETQKKELIDGIRAGLGLDDNPTVHLKDLQTIVRDMVLQQVEAGKKTAGSTDRDETQDDDDEENPFKKFDFAARLAEEMK